MRFFLTAISILTLITSPASAEGLADILPEKLFNAKGKKVDASLLEGKYVGLYFSAHWCPPCRAFTPLLVQFRNRHLEDNFEVVFVSFDDSNTEKQNYIRNAGMEWPSIKGADSKTAKKLAQRFQVEGFPSLIVLDPTGKIVSLDGRSDVMLSPETALETWKGAESS